MVITSAQGSEGAHSTKTGQRKSIKPSRTESETPWTGRSETCPTTRQNELLVPGCPFL